MTKQQSIDDYEQTESVFAKMTSDCIGSMKDNILAGEPFRIHSVEIFESEYEGKINENAILEVSKGGLRTVKVYTGAKAILSKLKALNKNGVSLMDDINDGFSPLVSLRKEKSKSGQFYNVLQSEVKTS